MAETTPMQIALTVEQVAALALFFDRPNGFSEVVLTQGAGGWVAAADDERTVDICPLGAVVDSETDDLLRSADQRGVRF